jgi:hypothetical protein
MNNEELKTLRTPLVVLLVMIAVAGAAVYYTDMLAKAASTDLARQKGVFQTAQSRMRQSGDEKDTIVKYVDTYRELEKNGFAGEEQRINWLDALRNANTRAELFGVSYQIGIQHAYPHATEYDPGSISLQESLMELDLRLMHEGDLLRFFDELRSQKVGLFDVKDCTLIRIDRAENLRNSPYLNAKCNLSWITARPNTSATGSKR